MFLNPLKGALPLQLTLAGEAQVMPRKEVEMLPKFGEYLCGVPLKSVVLSGSQNTTLSFIPGRNNANASIEVSVCDSMLCRLINCLIQRGSDGSNKS